MIGFPYDCIHCFQGMEESFPPYDNNCCIPYKHPASSLFCAGEYQLSECMPVAPCAPPVVDLCRFEVSQMHFAGADSYVGVYTNSTGTIFGYYRDPIRIQTGKWNEQ